MQIFKNKIIYFILILFTISMFIKPCIATDTSYVWSQISSPIVETMSSLNQDKRKFSRTYMWKCYFN